MKKTFSLIVGLLYAGPYSAHAQITNGVVVAATGIECSNYFVVKTGDTYALLQWNSGYMPDKGDEVSGEFDKFSVEDISVKPQGKIHAYVEDYDLTLDMANDKLRDKCN